MKTRKHFQNRKPVFVAVAKKDKAFNMNQCQSAKFVNKYPQRCLILLGDLFTEQKHW